jgi:ATP-binding cassette subfamily B (MDR/TAP) protein 1
MHMLQIVTTYISIIGFSYTGERITKQIRELYLRAIFRQNIAFFDFLGSGGTATLRMRACIIQDPG